MASAVISEKKNRLKRLKSKYYSIIDIRGNKRKTIVNDVLPFRVRFTTIGIGGYGPNDVPAIGIAIIGVNNYIL